MLISHVIFCTKIKLMLISVGEETTVPPPTTELPAEVSTEEDIDEDGGWVGDLPGFEFKVTQNGLNYGELSSFI